MKERLLIFTLEIAIILSIIFFAIYLLAGDATRLPVFNLITVAMLGR